MGPLPIIALLLLHVTISKPYQESHISQVIPPHRRSFYDPLEEFNQEYQKDKISPQETSITQNQESLVKQALMKLFRSLKGERLLDETQDSTEDDNQDLPISVKKFWEQNWVEQNSVRRQEYFETEASQQSIVQFLRSQLFSQPIEKFFCTVNDFPDQQQSTLDKAFWIIEVIDDILYEQYNYFAYAKEVIVNITSCTQKTFDNFIDDNPQQIHAHDRFTVYKLESLLIYQMSINQTFQITTDQFAMQLDLLPWIEGNIIHNQAKKTIQLDDYPISASYYKLTGKVNSKQIEQSFTFQVTSDVLKTDALELSDPNRNDYSPNMEFRVDFKILTSQVSKNTVCASIGIDRSKENIELTYEVMNESVFSQKKKEDVRQTKIIEIDEEYTMVSCMVQKMGTYVIVDDEESNNLVMDISDVKQSLLTVLLSQNTSSILNGYAFLLVIMIISYIFFQKGAKVIDLIMMGVFNNVRIDNLVYGKLVFSEINQIDETQTQKKLGGGFCLNAVLE